MAATYRRSPSPPRVLLAFSAFFIWFVSVCHSRLGSSFLLFTGNNNFTTFSHLSEFSGQRKGKAGRLRSKSRCLQLKNRGSSEKQEEGRPRLNSSTKISPSRVGCRRGDGAVVGIEGVNDHIMADIVTQLQDQVRCVTYIPVHFPPARAPTPVRVARGFGSHKPPRAHFHSVFLSPRSLPSPTLIVSR